MEALDEEVGKPKLLIAQIRREAGQQQELKIECSRDLQSLEAEVRRSRGAVAETVVDRASAELAPERQPPAALDERRAGQRSVVAAASKNRTLTTIGSTFNPAMRLQESNLKLQHLEGRRRAEARCVQGLSAQRDSAQAARGLQAERHPGEPPSGCAPVALSNQGDSLPAEAPVLQLIECKNRFITTFIKGSDLNRVRIGSPARIGLVGETLDLRGEVAKIRSGLGRVSLRDDTNPIPINLARRSQVGGRIRNDLPAPPLKVCPGDFSARLSFER
ncbi:hypothetical protein [Cyanobium sp. Morenito 9A2]|uniref:hypothetical protein n=1 Tax=Cyanobium sp. Morenito 9A2 TaxID=2823718 RepID=UPI0020CD292D|nr:hypothetical protein [Cyanobium sp. Morenito 9A2]MCP9848602.1 hypothetical protein [Cyanobium sp. Morenito 9A2]